MLVEYIGIPASKTIIRREIKMRVHVNGLYLYNPNGWDAFRPCQSNNLKIGQLVRVINLPMAPKANTMGQCYVAHPKTKQFICMLSTGSLMPLPDESRTFILNFLRKRKLADGPIVFQRTETGDEIEVITQA